MFSLKNMEGNKGMGFLTDEEDGWGFVLTLMKAIEGTQAKYPGTFHIGFFMEGKETMDEIHLQLKQDGFEVPTPEDTGHSYGFYVKAPAGFTVEVGA